jgi:hypothetical protein
MHNQNLPTSIDSRRRPLSPTTTPLASEKGSAILGVLCAIFVVCVLLQVNGFDKILQSNAISSNARLKTGRDSIASQIEKYASLPVAFRKSIGYSSNLALQNCVLGTGPSACLGDGTEYPLSLYSVTSNGTVQMLAGPAGPVSAGGAHPVLYDVKGNLCETGAVTASLACPFEVFTSFTAKCPAATGSPCSKAEAINVHYLIRLATTVSLDPAMRGKVSLPSIEKVALDVQTKEIMPPVFGYIPNPITTITMIAGTTGSTVVSQTLTSLQEAYDLIVKIVGNTTLAQTIATSLFTNDLIRDSSLITAFTNYWLQNPAAAAAAAQTVGWRMHQWSDTVTATDVANMAQVISGITDPKLQVAIAGGAPTTTTEVQSMTTALNGITDPTSMASLGWANITDPIMAQGLANAITGAGLSPSQSNAIALAAKVNTITDSSSLQNYANILKTLNITDYWTAYYVIVDGGDTVAKATTIQQHYLTLWANETPSTGGTTTTTVSTPTTVVTSGSLVPVSTTAACTSAATCGTQIGM